jgi:hypothetical protein
VLGVLGQIEGRHADLPEFALDAVAIGHGDGEPAQSPEVTQRQNLAGESMSALRRGESSGTGDPPSPAITPLDQSRHGDDGTWSA